MYISRVPILLTLGGKCLLNWVVVILQRRQIGRSFLGVFSISLAFVDTVLMLSIAKIYIHSEEFVVLFGYMMTKYDPCLLLQITGHISVVLQWPVTLMASVDHLSTVTRKLKATTFKPTWVFYSYATAFVWFITALYFLLLYDFVPDIYKDNTIRCRIFHSVQTLHITLLLLLVLASVAVFSAIKPLLKSHIPNWGQTPCRMSFVQETVQNFFHTWTPFLVFLAVPLFLPMGIPSYMDLNVVWLCFLNSLLVAIVLCAVCPSSQVLQDRPKPPAEPLL
ncbi:putative G-protein coupled receptor 160 [Austrofundulus limnaeus]|uniref:G-protein coupled receptor 160 n=1 Tax=Austrofundulus limnaeus TaxID=52670 RepID=A0A2I4B544_AUSLI|nr:PREDICTED: probable G-protein coupled receptor 160 [Austrofundulus limnaeus]